MTEIDKCIEDAQLWADLGHNDYGCDGCKHELQSVVMYPCSKCRRMFDDLYEDAGECYAAPVKKEFVKYICRDCIHGPCSKEFEKGVAIPAECYYSSRIVVMRRVVLGVDI